MGQNCQKEKNILYDQEKIITVPSLIDMTLLSYFRQPIPITKIPTIITVAGTAWKWAPLLINCDHFLGDTVLKFSIVSNPL